MTPERLAAIRKMLVEADAWNYLREARELLAEVERLQGAASDAWNLCARMCDSPAETARLLSRNPYGEGRT